MGGKLKISVELLRKAIREVFGVEPNIEILSSSVVKAEFDNYKLFIQCFEEYRGCQASLYYKGKEVVMCKLRCYDFEFNEERARKVAAVLRQARVPAEYGLGWE